MPFLDRTSEIQSIIQNQQQKKQYEQSGNGKKNAKKTQDKDVNSAQFNDKARQVSKELQETADLLQKLTKLVKKKTPFDDNSELIKNLTLKVKEQLSNQDYSLRSLQDVIDKKQEKEKKNQQTQHSSHIITGLNSKLLYATEQFQNVLKTRTTQMKSDKKRRNMYTFESGVKSLSSLTVNQTAASPNARVQLGQNMNAAGSSDDSSIGNEKIDELISEGSQLQQMNTSSVNRNLLASRTDDILSIEREVEKLGGMFNHLAVMIKHHGELTQRIDQNLNMAADDLEKGETELIKVWENTKGNTGLILKIFAVLVVFIIIVGLLVVR